MPINNYAQNCTFIENQYVGVQQVQTQYVGNQQADPEVQQLDGLKLASLCKYVPLPEQVENIARQLQTVRCAQDFKQVVRQIVDMYTPQQKAVIITKPFREALMAFVTDWQPSDNAVYRQCYEVCNE